MRRSNATNRCIVTNGEIFADGAMIDLVSGSSSLNKVDLLLWNGSKATVGRRVEHGGCIYEAPELPLSLYRATRFPSHCHDYGSARGLYDLIADLFNRHLDFPDRESGLLACFSISTWLGDRLPIAPSLTLLPAPGRFDFFVTNIAAQTVRIGPGYCATKESVVRSVMPSTVACAARRRSNGSL